MYRQPQLLRDKPTQNVETRSVEDLVGVLERLGVAKVEQGVIEGEAVEESA